MQFPDQHFSIVILSNLSNFRTGRIARKIADLYLADQFTEPPAERQRERSLEKRPEPISLPLAQLKKYTGKYHSDELDITYTLDVENNSLILKLRETSNTLIAYSIDNFGWGRRKLEFIKNREKKTTGFVLQEGIVKNMRFEKISKR
jgi:hypothetical protein